MSPIILSTQGIQDSEQEEHKIMNTDHRLYSGKHSEIQQRREMQIRLWRQIQRTDGNPLKNNILKRTESTEEKILICSFAHCLRTLHIVEVKTN